MSSQEEPDLLSRTGRITVEELRALTGAATPQFALQLRDRVQKLIEGLTEDDPVRAEGMRQIARLEELALEGQNNGHMQENELPLPSLTIDPEHTG